MSIQGFEYAYNGLGHVGSYQVSGVPYATSSLVAPATSSAPLQVTFPAVTKFIVVKNINPTTGTLRIGFSANGVASGSNYFLLDKGESFSGELKVTSLFLLSNNGTPISASVIAGLTTIHLNYDLMAQYSGSVGIG
jgi:hypothetical protein